ncbi:MAG: hypothetical protein ABI679_00210 [Gemmatimonadota bacterium]
MATGAMVVARERATHLLNWTTLSRLLATTLQLGLAVLIVRQFQIESRAFYNLSLLVLGGFVLHVALPAVYRLPFFALLSLTGTLVVLGIGNGLWVLGLGGLLLVLCHLPARFGLRLGLILGAAILLAAFRTRLLPSGIPLAIWPVLASMFMFRMAIYLYDLNHSEKAGSPAQIIAYFFMLPNTAFPLFPVVDYKTFIRTYYDEDEWQIYQRGMQWILRGLLHLIAYRLVYHYLTLDLAEVRTGPQVIEYIFSSFILYLRVSGMYHIAVGILHLFGFRLPETNHFWLFCQSFTDLWRRMNIYFKDFMMKLVYYPSFFRLRRTGNRKAIALALVAVFVMTWALHAVQWFWLRGGLLLTFQDMLFYVILGSLVIYQSLKEAKPGRRRMTDTGQAGWSARRSLNAFLTMGLLMTVWSFWTADSVDQWLAMWSTLSVWPARGTAIVAVSLIGYLAMAGLPWRAPDLSARKPAGLFRPALLTTGALSLIFVVGQPRIYQRLSPRTVAVVQTIQENRLNQRDNAILLRGYYEKVDNGNQLGSQLWEVKEGEPDNLRITETAAFRGRDDFLGGELIPSISTVFKEREFQTNRWGMHDRDYEHAKAPGTWRVTLLGPSDVMGPGVGEGETFEALVEERLNREHRGDRHQRYEILNFGVAAFTLPQQVAMLDQRALEFDPDAVMITFHPASDPPTALRYVTGAVLRGTEIPYPELQGYILKSGVTRTTREASAKRQLWPYANAMLEWSFRQMAEACRARGIPIVLLVLDAINEPSDPEQPLIRYADSLGYIVVDLRNAPKGHDPGSLMLAEWDRHPNKLGHRLLADALYGQLVSLGDTLGLGLKPTSTVSLTNQEEQ